MARLSARRQTADAGRRRGHCRWHEGLGAGARRNALYALVPADDRLHRREARQLHLARRRRKDLHGVFRQGAGERRIGRILVPVGRPARDIRGARLHRVGPHGLRLHQGRQPLYPDGLLLLFRRSARQKDAAAPLHQRRQPAGRAHPAPVRRHGDEEGHAAGRPGAGIFPCR